MDLVQLLKQKEERDRETGTGQSAIGTLYEAPQSFLRFGGTSRRSYDNANVPTPKKDTQEKKAQTSLDEPLILK